MSIPTHSQILKFKISFHKVLEQSLKEEKMSAFVALLLFVYQLLYISCLQSGEHGGVSSCLYLAREVLNAEGEELSWWNSGESTEISQNVIKSNRKPVEALANEVMTRWKRSSWGHFHILGNKSCFHVLATACHLNMHVMVLIGSDTASFSCPLSLLWAKTSDLSLAKAEQDSLTPIENRFILGEDLASYLVTEIGTRAIAFKRTTYYWW